MVASLDSGFGLYVHWPFCQSKCPYCDFNSHVAETIDHAAWKSAYLAEFSHFADLVGDRVLSSIYFGGGTPSLMPPFLVEAIISVALSRFRAVNDLEVTLEANPTSVEMSRFRGYRAAGVNRVSIGAQALDEEDLRRLGRLHDVREALVAIEASQSVFDRSSFDLIYARQNQSLIRWESELSWALRLGGEHLSLYQLTIEEGTVFYRRRASGKLPGLPDEDLQADFFELTQGMTAAAGLPVYEISNHARSGAESRHNLTYWRGGDWLGIGPGAHGRFYVGEDRFATVCQPSPSEWLGAAQGKGNGCMSSERLSRHDVDVEYLLMGLRLAEGIDLDRLEVTDIEEEIGPLIESGHLELHGRRLATTATGRPLLNMILGQLLR